MNRRITLLVLLSGAVGGIGWIDWVTGPRTSFALFYLIPIQVAGWWLGGAHAWLLTGCACLAQFLADVAWTGPPPDLNAIWNLFTRVVLLGALGHMTARVRRDRDTLDERLAQRTSAHIAAVEQLRHRDRLALAGQIAAGIAHELGTPLNVVSGRAQLILEKDATREEIERHVHSIREQAERVTATIRQLLDFVRRRGPDLGPTDLNELCRQVVELIQPFATKRQVRLEFTPADQACVVPVDYNQIQQAVSNLIMNAIQAMAEGGQVRVRVRNVVTHSEKDAQVAIEVEDTGTGIAPENVKRIFEPFFTTQKAGEGTGLGLSITEGIVRDHGGRIDVESDLGKGSRFTFYLPASPEQRLVKEAR
jgi:two-component system NtrC family sensor kinase